MATFNVLFEPWIPVKDKQGKTVELGILDVLEKAPDLMEIAEPSPLMRYGIYRLLIAFLTDALRPEIEEDLADLMADGRFPMERIRQYVRECEKDGPCFDLFDEKQPFLQSAYKKEWDESKRTSVAKLIHELPSGNNVIHFEHLRQDEHSICPEVCIKSLCAVNVFCTSGLQGPSGINGAPPWYLIIIGNNLFETLIYSLWVPVNIEIPLDNPKIAWRNAQQVEPNKGVTTTSYLYGLTWQSRRICLIPDETGGHCTFTGKKSKVLVREAYFQAGWKFEGYDNWKDPHVAYHYKDNTRSSLKPHEGRASWRYLGPILLSRSNSSSNQCPAIIEQYQSLIRHGLWKGNKYLQTEIYGVATDKASLEGWQHDRFNIDWKAVGDNRKAAWLNEALLMTEATNKVLRKALHRIPPQHGKRKINQKWFCDELIEQAEMSYFAIMRRHFFEKLIPMVAKTDVEEYHWRDKLNSFWIETLQKEAWKVFDQIVDGIGLGSKNLERRVAAEKSLSWSFNDLRKGVSNE
jgi:CRISPR system Cascade subunit CasA